MILENTVTLPEELAAVVEDELALDTALSVLSHFSLITKIDGMLAIRRLVQMMSRNQMGEAQAAEWVEIVIKLIYQSLPDWTELDEWTDGSSFISHMITCSSLASQIGIESPLLADLYNWIGYYFQYFGNYAEALPYYKYSLAIRGTLGTGHPDTANSLNSLGSLLQATGHHTEALRYYERALAIREQALGADHSNTAISLNNLGALLQAMGHWLKHSSITNALWPFTSKFRRRPPRHRPQHISLGTLLQAMGQLREARPYYERALAIYEQVLGPDHPDTARSLNNLGYLLQAMGNLGEARPYYERALAIYEKALGPDHPDTARSLNNLGSLLQTMGN